MKLTIPTWLTLARIALIPVLVGGATMPAAEALPPTLRGLANRNALALGDAGWRAALARLEALVARYRPAVFSEHLAWSTHDGRFFNDLLPLRYDAASRRSRRFTSARSASEG